MMRHHTLQNDVITPIEARRSIPHVRSLALSDLVDALRKGLDDFLAMPTHAIFLGLIYVVIGLALGRAMFGYDVFPLLYPAAAGFALLGPFAAVGLYELSRRREMGRDTNWTHIFDIRHSPSLNSILALGGLLLILFIVWIWIAHTMYIDRYGYGSHRTMLALANDLVTTDKGRELLLTGTAIGFVFAVVALCISVVSFPLLLDRNVGLAAAISTSVAVALKNPVQILAWGAIVAFSLLLGTLPILFGLAIVVPVLGHATWHLYRKALAQDKSPRPAFQPKRKPTRYAAEFPASLFVPSSYDDDDEPKT